MTATWIEIIIVQSIDHDHFREHIRFSLLPFLWIISLHLDISSLVTWDTFLQVSHNLIQFPILFEIYLQ